MKKVDMSPQAVTGRLRRVDELRDLCRTLAGPRLIYPCRTEVERRAVREMIEDLNIDKNAPHAF